MEASIRGERKGVVAAVLSVMVFLAERLQKIESEETVVVESTSYTVRGDSIATSSALRNEIKYRVLSLTYLKILTERSPFLSLAGTDPRKLTDALLQLADTAASLAAIQESSSDSALVSSALYPLSFLTALAEAEQARLTFLMSGKDMDAENYADKLTRAVEYYKQDLITFKKAFEQAVPLSARPYATEQDIISRENSLKALDDLYAAMMQTQSLIERRARCIQGAVENCDAAYETFAQIPSAPQPTPPSPAAINLAIRVRTIMANSGIQIPSQDNPMVLLNTSVCVKDDDNTALVFMLTEKGLMHVGDIRLLKTDTYKQVPFYKYFYDRGISYIPVYSSIYYKCPEIADDTGRILAVKAVGTFARQTPLSALAPAPEVPTLRALERRMSSPTLIYESDASEYLAAAQKIVARQALPATMLEAIASLSLQTRDRSGGLDQVIDQIVKLERRNLNILQKGVPADLDAPYLFFVRSGSPSVLLASNRSAIIQDPNIFQKNYLRSSQEPFTSFFSLADDPQAVAEVEKGMKFFEDVHKN